MNTFTRFQIAALLTASLFVQNSQANNEWSGSVGAEWQAFRHDSSNDEQSQNYLSIVFKPEYVHEWNDGQHQLLFSGFARLNNNNENQTHLDVRELYWNYASDSWEIRTGIRKVFWGVTESQHLVDIINQTDGVERFDGEEKLGQPMINIAYIQDWGTLDFFVLPGFRERSFPSEDARLRPPFILDNDDATYDSSLERKNVDLALRYSHYLGDWDFGISHFYGNSREPRIVSGNGGLYPHYDLIHQTGVDVQATIESWLWKFEGIHRSGMADNYFAATFGLEYSFFDIQSSGVDLGIVAEYLYDERGNEASTPFEDDSLIGLRLALNDEQSTEALLGIIVDNEGDGNVLNLEASRRIGDSFKINLEASLFFDGDVNDQLYAFQKDDYAQLTLSYFY